MPLFGRSRRPQPTDDVELPQRFATALEAILDSPFAVPRLVRQHPGLFAGTDASFLQDLAKALASEGHDEEARLLEHAMELGGRLLKQYQLTEVDEDGVQESIAGAHALSKIVRTEPPENAVRQAAGILFIETQQGNVALREAWDDWLAFADAIDSPDSGINFAAAVDALRRVATSQAAVTTRSRAAFLLALLAWWMRDWRTVVHEQEEALRLASDGPLHNLAELSGGYVALVMRLVEIAHREARGGGAGTTWEWFDEWLDERVGVLSATPGEGLSNGSWLQMMGRALVLVHWTWNRRASPFRGATLSPTEAALLMSRIDEQSGELWALAEWAEVRAGAG